MKSYANNLLSAFIVILGHLLDTAVYVASSSLSSLTTYIPQHNGKDREYRFFNSDPVNPESKDSAQYNVVALIAFVAVLVIFVVISRKCAHNYSFKSNIKPKTEPTINSK